jgi:hypothetical protein
VATEQDVAFEEVSFVVRVDTKTLATMERLTKSDKDGFSRALDQALTQAVEVASQPAPDNDAKQTVWKRAFVTKDTEEERYVLGVAMEPDETDTEGDTQSAAEIRKACFAFMESYRTGGKAGHLGEMHKRMADGDLIIVENYLAPVDMTIETPRGPEKVKKDTWLMGLRVAGESIWEAIKKGDYTGLSIGGMATRTPVS